MKMKTIENISKKQCTGCMMCGDICPNKAISFEIDLNDGFWYALIDSNKCTKCGLCYKKCPIVSKENIIQNEKPLACIGVKSKDKERRYYSTSGGFFGELATDWGNNGGYCVGAEYDSENMVFHIVENDIDRIPALSQSKYVQSNTQGIYAEVKKLLLDNHNVMFCGTPCQVAALNSFLGKGYDNLLTVDFVCCGICSPGVYKKYLEWLEDKYNARIKRVWFKNKEYGWRRISTRVDFENGKKYIRIGSCEPYMIAFVKDALSMRECCENCRFRGLPHKSDITLADFWGIERVNNSFDDDKGVSALVINTVNGLKRFKMVAHRLDYFETSVEEISAGNFTIYESKVFNPKREEFLFAVMNKGFGYAVKKYSSYRGVKKVRAYLSMIKYDIKRLIIEGNEYEKD